MAASRETLQDIAAERQLQPATLERVIRLIDILARRDISLSGVAMEGAEYQGLEIG